MAKTTSSNQNALRDSLLAVLREESRKWFINQCLKKIVGWKYTLAINLFLWAFDYAGVPIYKALYRRGRVTIRKGVVHIVVGRIQEATNEEEFNNAADDLYNRRL